MTTMQGAVLLTSEAGYTIELQTVPIPIPKSGEVLVKIHAATINPTDVDVQRGKYAGMIKRARKQRPIVTGLELSGVVASSGGKFKVGDEVIGYVDLLKAGLTHAEYAAVPEKVLTRKPANLTHAEAVTLPIGALTAFFALHKQAKIQAGSRILINGASGGVGTYAIQLAKLAGAHITAVSGTNGLQIARELGADIAKNYRTDTVLSAGEHYDLIFDVANTLSFAKCRPFLTGRGVYITTDPFKDLWGFARAVLSRKRSPYLMILNSASPEFETIADLAAQGKLRPVVDSIFPLAQIADGFAHVASGSKTGRVVVEMV